MGENQKPANGSYTAGCKPSGMVDAHAHHNCGATCPLPLIYAQVETSTNSILSPKELRRLWTERLIGLVFARGVQIQNIATTEMGSLLIDLNTRLFSMISDNPKIYSAYKELSEIHKEERLLLNGRDTKDLTEQKEAEKLRKLEKRKNSVSKEMLHDADKCVPSLVIVPTMDMELAHLMGYDGRLIYQQSGRYIYYLKRSSANPYSSLSPQDLSHESKNKDKREIEAEAGAQSASVEFLDTDNKLIFQKWKRQVWDTEAASASNHLRHFPLFFYDPRRYRFAESMHFLRTKGGHTWKEPFIRILGSAYADPVTDPLHRIDASSRIWIGFKMYPALGYRPFDERCGHLKDFYAECEQYRIPILTHCAPGGMGTHEARFYEEYDTKYCSKRGNRSSDSFSGKQSVDKCPKMDYFYRNYGHPENWRPVLNEYKDLHLCLAHFGGDLEWKDESMYEWALTSDSGMPPREWIRTIIELTKKPNVYTDISCLDIYNDAVRLPLTWMLRLISNKNENNPYKHLQDKLIFGSDWYLTYLTDIAKNSENANYINYCRSFKKMFYKIDKSGKFWEQVSLINPWKCYSLTSAKFQEMSANLSRLAAALKVGGAPKDAAALKQKLDDIDKYIRGR
ncbi:MAG: hypothetical protein FWB85_07180 [Chitinispirillia bacterium]|nr:hypothetical protein [Chitinispirillia bacterium]MCL2242030.1 hypothetical protein [Chitinispirillia bacterium]